MEWRSPLIHALTAALLIFVAVPGRAQDRTAGEWLSGRGGPSSRGASSQRLGWEGLPEVVGAVDLSVGTPLDARSVLSVPGRGVD